MKLTILGTGNATVTECYNTCFVISDDDRHFMVDGGGGNTILHQLKAAGLNWMDMRDIFVTHKHIDHLLGIIWMMRMILQNMNRGKYEGEATIYGHEEVIRILKEMAGEVLSAKEMKYIDDRLHMVVVEDGEEREIIGKKVTFFDIHSTKAKQFGFCMQLDEDEKKMFLEDLGLTESGLEKLIAASYRLLGLMSFLTAGEDETRAWTIKVGTKAPQAAGKIHTDFERGFIKAEVVNYQDLLDCGSYAGAREKGLVRMEGKDYIVRDGDVILFRFNV